jgi:hypothetical protein
MVSRGSGDVNKTVIIPQILYCIRPSRDGVKVAQPSWLGI